MSRALGQLRGAGGRAQLRARQTWVLSDTREDAASRRRAGAGVKGQESSRGSAVLCPWGVQSVATLTLPEYWGRSKLNRGVFKVVFP